MRLPVGRVAKKLWIPIVLVVVFAVSALLVTPARAVVLVADGGVSARDRQHAPSATDPGRHRQAGFAGAAVAV
jgi:hypothetical protein